VPQSQELAVQRRQVKEIRSITKEELQVKISIISYINRKRCLGSLTQQEYSNIRNKSSIENRGGLHVNVTFSRGSGPLNSKLSRLGRCALVNQLRLPKIHLPRMKS